MSRVLGALSFILGMKHIETVYDVYVIKKNFSTVFFGSLFSAFHGLVAKQYFN
jgi:hypothetical protein